MSLDVAMQRARVLRNAPAAQNYSTESDIISESAVRRERIQRELDRRTAEYKRKLNDAVQRAVDAQREAALQRAKERAEADEEAARRPKVRAIVSAAAAHFGVPVIDIYSGRRTASVVRPRQVAMYLAKVLTLRSYPEIGHIVGNRDHTTALHAVRKIEGLLAGDMKLRADVAAIKSKLGCE